LRVRRGRRGRGARRGAHRPPRRRVAARGGRCGRGGARRPRRDPPHGGAGHAGRRGRPPRRRFDLRRPVRAHEPGPRRAPRPGGAIYVGLPARTNAAGAARLAEVFGPRGLAVRTVELPPGVLHLKSVCSPLGNDCVLVAAGALPASTFRVARVLVAPPDEARAANAMACGGGALVAARCPETQALVEAAGLRVVPVDTSELAKADGALTCLSILVD